MTSLARFAIVKTKINFVSLILWYKTNRMWFSVVCTLIDNDTRHHSGQNVVDSETNFDHYDDAYRCR